MNETLSLEESRELVALCKAGKLYQVEEWIDQVPVHRKCWQSSLVHPRCKNS